MAEKQQTKKAAADEAAVLEKIAGWRAPFDVIGQRVHELITAAAPELQPRLWYGAPGYAKGSGPVVIFYRLDEYFSFGLTEKANVALGDGDPDLLIPSAWFITELDEPTEQHIAAIVRHAAA